MVKIVKENWDKYREDLQMAIRRRIGGPDEYYDELSYRDLVSLACGVILRDPNSDGYILDHDNVHVIDDGEYQGTLIFLIPYHTYQPSANQYIMCCSWYGSCSGCDTLQAIYSDYRYEHKNKERCVNELLMLCKDILCTMTKPYNSGWQHDPDWEEVEFE